MYNAQLMVAHFITHKENYGEHLSNQLRQHLPSEEADRVFGDYVERVERMREEEERERRRWQQQSFICKFYNIFTSMHDVHTPCLNTSFFCLLQIFH